MRRIVLLLAVVLAGAATSAAAQARPRVEITLDTLTRDPKVRILNLMEDERWREALDDAFRISLSWRVELWKSGGFLGIGSSPVRTLEFSIVIRREPLLGQYFITYFIPGKPEDERQFLSIDDFVLNLERAIAIDRMAPRREGSWFYVANLQISALDEEQFGEMQRFLGGAGRASGGGVIGNFLVRSVGLPTKELPAARTQKFRVP